MKRFFEKDFVPRAVATLLIFILTTALHGPLWGAIITIANAMFFTFLFRAKNHKKP